MKLNIPRGRRMYFRRSDSKYPGHGTVAFKLSMETGHSLTVLH